MIELLKDLQEKDIEILKTQEIIESLPKIIKEEEEKIQGLKKEFGEKTNIFSELQKEFRHKERELKIYEDKIDAFKGRMHEIKTKKELDALEDEIKKQKELKDKIEEEGLLLMEEIEIRGREVQDKEKDVQIKEELFKNTKEEKEKVLKEAEERYKILSSLREKIAEKIDGRVLELYETIRKSKDNIALASASNNICSACQIALRPQIINEIKEQAEIIRCESCLRILYI